MTYLHYPTMCMNVTALIGSMRLDRWTQILLPIDEDVRKFIEAGEQWTEPKSHMQGPGAGIG